MHRSLLPWSITAACTAIFLSIGAALGAERKLTDFQPFSASVPADFTCRPDITVTVRAPDEAAFTSNRVELQKLIGGLRAILGFECPDTPITNLLVVGKAGGKEVYRGAASGSGNWLLTDLRTPVTPSEPVEQATLPSVPKKVTVPEQNLIQNGSFELGVSIPDNPGYLPLNPGSTAINNWAVIRGEIDYYGTGWVASDAHRSLDLNGTPGVGGIAQTFATTSGQKYSVRFDMAGHISGLLQTMRVSAAGQSQDFTFQSRTDPHNLGWQTQDWEFTAIASETRLEFYSLQTGYPFGGPALDNVSVAQVGAEGYYAVLGDSYSAGVGNPPYESDSPYFSLGCGRSPYAYGPKLSAAVPTLGKLAFIACGGAVTDDFYSFTGHVSQLYQLSILPNVLSVTLTISGNDIGFQDIITTCIESEAPQGCKKNLELAEAIERRLAGLAGTRKDVQTPSSNEYPTGRPIVPLTKLLKDIYEETSRKARIFVGGYPRLFGKEKSGYALDSDGGLYCPLLEFGLIVRITYDDAQWLNDWTDRLNGVLSSAVEAVKKEGMPATFVSVRKAYTTHGLCDTGNRWIHPLKPDWRANFDESIHPTAEGHEKGYMNHFRQVMEGL